MGLAMEGVGAWGRREREMYLEWNKTPGLPFRSHSPGETNRERASVPEGLGALHLAERWGRKASWRK